MLNIHNNTAGHKQSISRLITKYNIWQDTSTTDLVKEADSSAESQHEMHGLQVTMCEVRGQLTDPHLKQTEFYWGSVIQTDLNQFQLNQVGLVNEVD